MIDDAGRTAVPQNAADGPQDPPVLPTTADRWERVWWQLTALFEDVRAYPYRTTALVGGVLFGAAALRDGIGAAHTAYATGNPFLAVLDLAGTVLVSLLGYALVAGVGMGLVLAGSFVAASVLGLGITLYSRYRRARLRRVFILAGTGVVALVLAVLAHVGAVELLATVAVLAVVVWATAARRARARRNRWLIQHVARAAGVSAADQPRAWRVEADQWDDRGRLVDAVVWYPADIAASDPNRRAAMERAIVWALRHYPNVEYTVSWLAGATALRVVAQPPLPSYVGDRVWPRLRGGIVVGVCAHQEADAIVRGTELGDLGVRLWWPDDERDLLIAGVKGSGKTVLGRGIVVRGLRDGWFPGGVWILDGKSGGDYAALDGRQGIRSVARDPDAWAAVLRYLVEEIMRPRYEETYAYQRGLAARPSHPRVAAVLDEVQNIRTQLGAEAMDPLDALARMARAARVSLVVLTQRPDASDAIPGAIRDQLEDRVAVGWLSRDGGRMVLDDDWRAVVADPDRPTERPRGRAVVRIAGRLSAVQVPDLPSPVDRPEVEPLYPPRTVDTAPKLAPTTDAAPVPDGPPSVPPQRPRRNDSGTDDSGPSDDTPPPTAGRPTRRPPRRTQ